MDFVYFAAVDENLNLPPEIRAQLAKSPELGRAIIPMSQATRDNLREEEHWVGRTIYNTSTNIIEFWTTDEQFPYFENGRWTKLVDILSPLNDYNGWDPNFYDQTPARIKLADSHEFKYMVRPFSQYDINIMGFFYIGAGLFDGRVVYNKTTKHLQSWSDSTETWTDLLDENYIPDYEKPSEYMLYPQFLFSDELSSDSLWGRISLNHIYKKVICTFSVYMSEPFKEISGGEFQLVLPVSGKETGLANFGSARLWTGSNYINCRTLKLANENCVRIEYTADDGKVYRLKDNNPFSWNVDQMALHGQIVYESD